MEKSISFAIKGASLNYVNLGTPVVPSFSDGTGGAQWSVQVRDIAEDVAMDLKEAGAPVTLDGDSFVMNIKQYTVTAAGKRNTINVFDSEGNTMTKAKADKIGQGSKGHVAGYMYTYTNSSGTGVAVRLTDVQVTEMVEKKPETKEERIARLFG